MTGLVAAHRAADAVEPICRVLEMARSRVYSHAAREADPGARPDRWWRGWALVAQIRRVRDQNRQVDGVRKVCKQLCGKAGRWRGARWRGGCAGWACVAWSVA
ncbi:hypothetical protein XthCFBP4691_16520, partial [Xanthomonas theicola]